MKIHNPLLMVRTPSPVHHLSEPITAAQILQFQDDGLLSGRDTWPSRDEQIKSHAPVRPQAKPTTSVPDALLAQLQGMLRAGIKACMQ